MTIDRSRRITFEEIADLYDEVRPGYPDELVEDVLEFSGISKDGYILEIGCGPGNATISFARRGYRILAIELGQRLAAYAVERCRVYPGVKVVNSSFEDYPLREDTFDLAIAADSFHWIPSDIGYPKVARALKDTGSAAFFWYLSPDPQADWSRAVEDVYQMTAPGIENPDKPSMSAEELKTIILKNFSSSECFSQVNVRQYSWMEIQSTDQYLKLLRTFSGHRGMEEPTRNALYTGIRNVLERFGGQVSRPLSVILFQARVKKE